MLLSKTPQLCLFPASVFSLSGLPPAPYSLWDLGFLEPSHPQLLAGQCNTSWVIPLDPFQYANWILRKSVTTLLVVLVPRSSSFWDSWVSSHSSSKMFSCCPSSWLWFPPSSPLCKNNPHNLPYHRSSYKVTFIVKQNGNTYGFPELLDYHTLFSFLLANKARKLCPSYMETICYRLFQDKRGCWGDKTISEVFVNAQKGSQWHFCLSAPLLDKQSPAHFV